MQVFFQITFSQEDFDNFDGKCHLILQKDGSLDIDNIQLNIKDSEGHQDGIQWVNSDKLPAVLSACIDMGINDKLNNDLMVTAVYLWFPQFINQETLLVEALYIEPNQPINLENDFIVKNSTQRLLQIYPKLPSPHIKTLEARLESQNHSVDKVELAKDYEDNKEIQYKYQLFVDDADLKENSLKESILKDSALKEDDLKSDPIYQLEMIDELELIEEEAPTNSENAIWEAFDAADLQSLLDGFQDWLKASGRGDLSDRLPQSLIEKLSGDYKLEFWTSGQGVSTMILDTNPPRHSFAISIIQPQKNTGIAYCIQKPTNLDTAWSHQRWHDITICDNTITAVSPIIIE